MMMLLAAAIGGLGLICITSRKTLVGVLIGSQLLILGASMAFILCPPGGAPAAKGVLFGLFIVFSGVAQLVAGYAVAVRAFYLRKRIDMEEMRTLKR